MIELMYITNLPFVAAAAEKAGVNRIWIDLERLGKEERQKNMNSVKSMHEISDIQKVKSMLSSAQMQVRVNPVNGQSAEEIEQVIDNGADIIILPMYRSVKEVEFFLNCVKGRAKTVLLLETVGAMECLSETLQYNEVDEMYIGLNDLHLELKKQFMFQPLAEGIVDELGNKIRKSGKPFGFGGIAKLGAGALPAERILAEHYRLGSTRAILSRSFCNYQDESLERIEKTMKVGVEEIRRYEEWLLTQSKEYFLKNHKILKENVQEIVLGK